MALTAQRLPSGSGWQTGAKFTVRTPASRLQTADGLLLTPGKASEMPARLHLSSEVLPGTSHGRRRRLLRNRATLRQCLGLLFDLDTVGPCDDVCDRRDEDQAQQADDE
jgi:hypothetical protein